MVPDVRTALARLLGMRWSGQADVARRQVVALLHSVGDVPSTERAAVLYVLAITELELNELGRCHQTIARLLDVAAALDEPGWRSCALSLRVVATSRRDTEHAVIDDLVEAEESLREAGSEDVRAWAAMGLGRAYITVRCYELAVPPLDLAARIPEDVVVLPESTVVDWCHLAEAHLRTSFELEQLGQPEHTEAWRSALVSAGRAAAAARRASQQHHVHPRWAVLCDLLELAACRATHDVDPVDVAEVLGRAQRYGLVPEQIIASSVLTLVLTDRGEHRRALEAAARARLLLAAGYHDDDLNVLITWAGVRALARAGAAGGSIGLEQAQMSARRSRRERGVRVAAVRRELLVRQLAREHALERGMARLDPLTGLANLRALHEWVAHAQAHGWHVLMAVIDLDGLKKVNDTRGHAHGDVALRTVADALGDLGDRVSLIARTGGDEFVVTAPDDLAAPTTDEFGRMVRDALHRRRVSAARTTGLPFLTTLSVSTGVASTREGIPLEHLYACADERMYRAKASSPDARVVTGES